MDLNPHRHRGICRPSAFTLIELLIVVGLIGLLIGLAVPALRGARGNAGLVNSLANIRSISQTFTAYIDENRGYFPWAPPYTPLTSGPETSDGYIMSDDPFILRLSWPSLFVKSLSWSEHYPAWLGAGRSSDGDVPWRSAKGEWLAPGYVYCASFMGTASAWDASAVASSVKAAGVQASLVRAPARKALLFDDLRAYLRRPPLASDARPVGMVDGSAAGRPDGEATAPVQNRLTGRSPTIYDDTPLGWLGTDVSK